VLAAGEEAAYRLRILHELYGPGTHRLMIDAGLRRGMRVADIGCGIGTVTAWLAKIVGSEVILLLPLASSKIAPEFEAPPHVVAPYRLPLLSMTRVPVGYCPLVPQSYLNHFFAFPILRPHNVLRFDLVVQPGIQLTPRQTN
jgi:hypothetical protein